MSDDLYREAILDYYKHPRHKGHLAAPDIRSHDHNKQTAYAEQITRKRSVKRILFELDHFIKDKYGDVSIVRKFLNAVLQFVQ